ncbi:MAG TPA: MFS transporter [Ktedonobacteraceae bacterium]|nr:MFS transporter [Ktedonobacteraceae bacterium]
MQTLPKAQGELAVTEQMPLVHEQQPVKGLLRAFVALRHRNFRLFWFGQLISLIGTWMQSIGQAWLVLELTHSAFLLGLVGALQFLPILLFALFGGVLADRWPKRKVLLFTQSFAMTQAIILAVLVFTGTVQIWHIFVLATLLGLTNSIDMPTRQAFVVEMVGHESLTNAIALNSSVFNMARIVGPGIGGLIIATLGVAPLFLLNAVSFIAVLIGLAMIDMKTLYDQPKRGAMLHNEPKQSTFQSLREGLTYIVRTPSVFLIIMVVGVISLFGINFNVVLPLFATEVLHVGATGFGFISSAFGLGSLVAALWLAWGNKKPSIIHLLVEATIFCVILGLFALSGNYYLSLLLIAAVGFTQISFSAIANTTLQTVTPNHLRGRVMSVYMVVFAGSTPIGNLFIGGLAVLLGVPVALLSGATLSLAAAIGGWVFRKPAIKSLAEANKVYE